MVINSMQALRLDQRMLKRSFDLALSLLLLSLFGVLIIIAVIAASVETRSNGLFCHTRVGLQGRLFSVFKIKTMRHVAGVETSVTTSHDPRITSLGKFWRKSKIDELPQLFNVLVGDMSFVGPRPDVPGFADKLTGDQRIVLSLRPGITGPATLKYRDEEALLAKQSDPERFNREVIFPDKVRINMNYIQEWSFWGDIRYIWQTATGK